MSMPGTNSNWTAEDAARAYEKIPDYFEIYENTNYDKIKESLGTIQVDSALGSWNGDSFLIISNDNQVGYLTFGWGSCTVCDDLLGCKNWEDVAELRNKLAGEIHWEDSNEDLKDWLVKRDWKTDWVYYDKGLEEFLGKAWEYLGGEGSVPIYFTDDTTTILSDRN